MLEIIRLLLLFSMLPQFFTHYPLAVLFAQGSMFLRAWDHYVGICAGLSYPDPTVDEINNCANEAETLLEAALGIDVERDGEFNLQQIDVNTWELNGVFSFSITKLYTWKTEISIGKIFGETNGCRYAKNTYTNELEYNSCLPP